MIVLKSVPCGADHQAEWMPTSPAAVARAASSFDIGLPQLSLRGLSENWLWKECGHQHESMLASFANMSPSEMRQTGQCYVAFTAVRMERAAARLEMPPAATEPPDVAALSAAAAEYGIEITGPPGIPA